MKRKLVCLIGIMMLAVFTILPITASAEVSVGYDSADFYGQPSVILRADSAESLNGLSAEALPASVYMQVNASLEVVGADGASLGSFSQIWTEQVKGKALPVVQPQDAAAYAALETYLQTEAIEDLAIASSDITILMEAADASLRVMYIAGGMQTPVLRSAEIGKANVVGAQTMILDYAQADAELVRQIQARFKTVWVMTDGSSVQIADALGRGAYGIITPDAGAAYEVYGSIRKAVAAEEERPAVLARAPFVAAHRGDWGVTYSENTVGAIESASQYGATHAEIDIRLTADNQIVVFHNDNVTYNGKSVAVKSLTLAQIQEIVLSDKVSHIPTIDEVFASMRDGKLGDMLLIVEFKGQEADLATLFSQKVQEYGVSDNIVIISFYPAQIQRMTELLPSVPTSLLLYTTGGENALEQAAAVKSGIDMQRDSLRTYYGDGTLASAYSTMFRMLADRGYSLWLWTYETETMPEAFRYGVTGITTNNCWYSMNFIETLQVEKEMTVDSLPEEGSTIEVSARTYKGEEVQVPAKVVYLETSGKEATAVLVAQPEEGLGLISESVTFRAKAGGCSSAAAVSIGAVSVLLLAGAAVLLGKRKSA